MLTTLAISGYRSLVDLRVGLGSLTVVTGPNGSGKSNLHRALRLLAETAEGCLIPALAREGGFTSACWAGEPKQADAPHRVCFGFTDGELGYAIALGFPPPPDPTQDPDEQSKFTLDPEIKREVIFGGPAYRPAATLVDRNGATIKVRKGRGWHVLAGDVPPYQGLFDLGADPADAPEIVRLRDRIRGWRFYDHLRTDEDAPARFDQVATRTPVLAPDGRDLAAALQTIFEIGDRPAVERAIADAFPGARVDIMVPSPGRLSVAFSQAGVRRPFTAAELSDGTLRYLLLVAALLTPRPPPLMVLNEPETSLHPSLLPALGRLLVAASANGQIWVVTHAAALAESLAGREGCRAISLEKIEGETKIAGQRLLDAPSWHWP